MSNSRSRRAYGLLAPASDASTRHVSGFWLRVAVLFIVSVPIVAEAMDADPGADATLDTPAAPALANTVPERIAATGPQQEEPTAPAAVPVELVAVSETVAKGYSEVAFIPEATSTTTTTEVPAEAPARAPQSAQSESSPTAPTAAPAPPSTVVAPADDGPGEPLGPFSITCYSLRGTTASGAGVAEDGIAVDPRIIPLGSRVYVDGLGWKIARDTGSAIKGNKIDIWNPSSQYCRDWGRQSREVWLG
ncbi:MAG: 3D domain-containing protein [Acidimicrobiales bacterium]